MSKDSFSRLKGVLRGHGQGGVDTDGRSLCLCGVEYAECGMAAAATELEQLLVRLEQLEAIADAADCKLLAVNGRVCEEHLAALRKIVVLSEVLGATGRHNE